MYIYHCNILEALQASDITLPRAMENDSMWFIYISIYIFTLTWHQGNKGRSEVQTAFTAMLMAPCPRDLALRRPAPGLIQVVLMLYWRVCAWCLHPSDTIPIEFKADGSVLRHPCNPGSTSHHLHYTNTLKKTRLSCIWKNMQKQFKGPWTIPGRAIA